MSETVKKFREQYAPHNGTAHYALFIKATHWGKALSDDYEDQVKGWLEELEKLRHKLREAACVDLGYDLTAFAQVGAEEGDHWSTCITTVLSAAAYPFPSSVLIPVPRQGTVCLCGPPASFTPSPPFFSPPPHPFPPPPTPSSFRTWCVAASRPPPVTPARAPP